MVQIYSVPHRQLTAGGRELHTVFFDYALAKRFWEEFVVPDMPVDVRMQTLNLPQPPFSIDMRRLVPWLRSLWDRGVRLLVLDPRPEDISQQLPTGPGLQAFDLRKARAEGESWEYIARTLAEYPGYHRWPDAWRTQGRGEGPG
jgi:hypothetical protein